MCQQKLLSCCRRWCDPFLCEWWFQYDDIARAAVVQADIAQLDVVRPVFQETTSLGAAYAAGLSVGFYTEEQLLGGLGEIHEEVDVFKPQKTQQWADRKYQSWKKAVQLSFGLADLE